MKESERRYSTWELRKGAVLLGTIRSCHADFPWFVGEFEPTPDFEEYRPAFEEQSRLVEAERFEESIGQLEIIWEKLNRELEIVSAFDGKAAKNFLLYIGGGGARFRASFDNE